MSELERARREVAKQNRDADRRVTVARRLSTWYQEQLANNGWRETVEKIVRGEG